MPAWFPMIRFRWILTPVTAPSARMPAPWVCASGFDPHALAVQTFPETLLSVTAAVAPLAMTMPVWTAG
jgi:hypothetical protein